MEQPLSNPSPEQLRCWRLFVESALALVDVLDTELQDAAGKKSAFRVHFTVWSSGSGSAAPPAEANTSSAADSGGRLYA